MDVWKTTFAGGFNQSKYLYHYTGIDSAIKIICSDKLLFSPISNTNDTSEAKMKLDFSPPPNITEEGFRQQTNKIKDYLNKYKQLVRIMCFSMDAKISKADQEKAIKALGPKTKYYDVRGRGFALPRMWAQYAGDNKGVCFILDKEALLNRVKKKVAFQISNPVIYKKFFDRYIITASHMEELTEKIDMVGNGSLTLLNLIQSDTDFLKYNFFEKLDDWKNEHEFRIITLTDRQDSTIYVDKLSTYLRGIVLGEKVDPNYEKIIKMLLQENEIECDIRKITFGSNGCTVK